MILSFFDDLIPSECSVCEKNGGNKNDKEQKVSHRVNLLIVWEKKLSDLLNIICDFRSFTK